MKPAICRLCKHAHWLGSPHIWDDEVPVTNEEWRAAADYYPTAPETPRPRNPGTQTAAQAVPLSIEEEILIHGWPVNPAAPEAPRSNAPGPSRRTRDTGDLPASPKQSVPTSEQLDRELAPSPHIPGIAPSHAPSPNHRSHGTGDKALRQEGLPSPDGPEREARPPHPAQSPGTPDTAPSQPPKPKFDRNAYQREYMRRRRARQKESQ